MPNWLTSMQQTFEYYIVDPGTWKDIRRIDNVKSCTITRDNDTDTLGSATIDIQGTLGECYVRIYLITIQNGVKEKFPLGTFLVQSPSASFDGKTQTVTMDCYTPLLELKENPPPIGYYVPKLENVMDTAYDLTSSYLRAPVVKNTAATRLFDDFVAETEDTWLSFIKDLLSYAKYRFDIDEMGRILFAPDQDTASLQPIWTYDDGNSSILYPELTIKQDLFDIPNVVEVLYSNGSSNYHVIVTNDDPNSPTSTINRGRTITYRETNPSVIGNPTEGQIEVYARQLLRSMSTLECTLSYTHAYCPVRVGDCVRLNYSKAGLQNVKAKVISQNIKCEPGCPVSEKATFTTRLWG